MKELSVNGSLGDAYIQTCKLLNIKDNIIVYHHTKHSYWNESIQNVFSLAPNVKWVSVENPRTDLEEITSDSHSPDMEYFPYLRYDTSRIHYKIRKPYIIIQPHSGKDKGYNCKELEISYVEQTIKSYTNRCVLVGTSSKYKDIKGCINLISKTNIIDIIDIVINSEGFLGPEGFISFLALSHRKPSIVFFTDYEAVAKRIVSTPWASYCSLIELK